MGLPLLITNLSLPAELITPDEHRFHSAGPLDISQLGKVLQISGDDKHTGDFQGQFLTRSGSDLFRLLRATSPHSTYIKTALSTNPNSSTTGKETETNTTQHSCQQLLEIRF